MSNMKTNYGRAALLGSAATLLAASFAGVALAQQQQQQQTVEEVVVTGSRIASPEIKAVSPVVVVSAEAIKTSGVTNVQDLLLKNPAFGAPALSRANSAFLTSGTGVATVDLRNLGSNRTLVLIDGRRVVAGLPGTSTVDLNVIPTQFIERIDILTGGASSLYGSDAVAGVVNFVYKKNFEGVEANAQYGESEHGDDKTTQVNATFGGNFSENRGNVMAHLGYSKQTGVLSRNRANTVTDDLDTFTWITGDPKDYGVSAAPYYSSYPLQGRFGTPNHTGTSKNWTFDKDGNLQPCFSSNGGTAASSCGSYAGQAIGPDGFNRQYYRTISVPVQRYLFAARGHYDLFDNVSFFAEGTYNRTYASREIEPFPLDSSNIYPVDAAMPIETMVDGTPMLNPYVPAAIAADAVDTNGDGLKDITFARRLGEFGTRNGSTTREFFRFVTGLEGSLFNDKFHWDFSYNYGRTTEMQTSNGQVNVLNFANALQAITDVDDLNNNGSTTDVICASATAREQGCAPINIFGAGSISPEAVQYVAAEQTYQTQITQQILSGNLSGSLFDLPAGPLGIATGWEYRKEKSRDNNDALTNAGLNAGNALPDTHGAFHVTEGYVEVNVPIFKDQAFAKSMNVRAAARISDYSTVGTIWTWNAGMEWAPVDDIRFRGTYARSVRAPNIGELYTGPSQTFPTGLVDPCVGIGATGGGALGDNCRADPGVLANIEENGVFTLTQPDIQGISGFNSGNPNLKEERSRSYTLGAVITPKSIDFLRNFTLSVDYFNVDIKDAIVAPPRQFILDQCYRLGEQGFCNYITRFQTATGSSSVGAIKYLNASQVNSGARATDGIDFVATHQANLENIGLAGSLNTKVVYSHYFTGYDIPVQGADRDVFAGEIGSPKDRFTATMNYSLDKFKLALTGTYIGKSYEDDQYLASYDLAPRAIHVEAEFYLDMNMSYKVMDQAEVYFGIDNALNNKAPNILSGSPFNTTGHDTDASVYDDTGRRFYGGVRVKF